MVFHGQFFGEVHFILTYIPNDYLTTRNGIIASTGVFLWM